MPGEDFLLKPPVVNKKKNPAWTVFLRNWKSKSKFTFLYTQKGKGSLSNSIEKWTHRRFFSTQPSIPPRAFYSFFKFKGRSPFPKKNFLRGDEGWKLIYGREARSDIYEKKKKGKKEKDLKFPGDSRDTEGLNNQLTRMPLIVKWPEVKNKEVRVKDFSTLDTMSFWRGKVIRSSLTGKLRCRGWKSKIN